MNTKNSNLRFGVSVTTCAAPVKPSLVNLTVQKNFALAKRLKQVGLGLCADDAALTKALSLPCLSRGEQLAIQSYLSGTPSISDGLVLQVLSVRLVTQANMETAPEKQPSRILRENHIVRWRRLNSEVARAKQYGDFEAFSAILSTMDRDELLTILAEENQDTVPWEARSLADIREELLQYFENQYTNSLSVA